MSDLISRQDAINTSLEFFVEYLGGAFDENSQKELMVRLQRLSSAEPETRLVAEVTLTKDQIQDAVDKAVEKIRTEMKEPEPHWIPCSERLPENYERVLTTISIPNRESKVRSGYYHNGLFSNDNGDCWNSTDPEVKGWCKLPEPYKPESEE